MTRTYINGNTLADRILNLEVEQSIAHYNAVRSDSDLALGVKIGIEKALQELFNLAEVWDTMDADEIAFAQNRIAHRLPILPPEVCGLDETLDADQPTR